MNGIWLPIITPFKNGKIDFVSYKRMIDHYIEEGIHGIIPLGTTGESATLSHYEKDLLLDRTIKYVRGRVPIYWGHGGNNTAQLIEDLHTLNTKEIEGILSVSPYYNRPSQEGIYQHYKAISESTDLDILLYNIPYRTGRGMTNDTIRRLAELHNVIGIKDACGDFAQSTDLLMNRPADFSIMSGEDATLFSTLALGGNGGVTASAHLRTKEFIRFYKLMTSHHQEEALKLWHELYPIVPELFGEPNPAPIKHVLTRSGLIDEGGLRLPMTECSEAYKAHLDLTLSAEMASMIHH